MSIFSIGKKGNDAKKKISDDRKRDLLKSAIVSGCHIFYDERTGKVAIEGTLYNGTLYPVHVGIAFDKDSYLPEKEFVANMKSLMNTSNLVRRQFIDKDNKYSTSTPYEVSSSNDIRLVEAAVERRNSMQFASDVIQDISGSLERRAYTDYVRDEMQNAIKAAKLASMSKISAELQEYNAKYGYLLNSKSFEHEIS